MKTWTCQSSILIKVKNRLSTEFGCTYLSMLPRTLQSHPETFGFLIHTLETFSGDLYIFTLKKCLLVQIVLHILPIYSVDLHFWGCLHTKEDLDNAAGDPWSQGAESYSSDWVSPLWLAASEKSQCLQWEELWKEELQAETGEMVWPHLSHVWWCLSTLSWGEEMEHGG